MKAKSWVALAGAALIWGAPAAAQDDAAEAGASEAAEAEAAEAEAGAEPADDAVAAVSAEDITGDPAAGEAVFRRCQSCHAVGEGAENKIGPVLTGVVGRPAGQVADYEYSEAMQEAGAGGLVWTVADLMAFLEKPRDKVPGTTMAFPGLRSEEDRADVIAFLHGHPAE